MTSSMETFFGPGSQPGEEDGARLDFIQMPSGMMTYSMPEIPEASKVAGLDRALALLQELLVALRARAAGLTPPSFELAEFDRGNRELIDQVLGEGEVSIVAGAQLQAQESVLTGVWRLRMFSPSGALERDLIEIGEFPAVIRAAAFEGAAPAPKVDVEALPDGVVNAPPILTEIEDKARAYRPGAMPHVVNLTLLPLSDEDLAYIDSSLGKGGVTILSRGYGNCRITATAVRNVWWVQYFNSQDALILNTIEVSDVPSVACAAPEDLADSAERLMEILEVCR